MNEKLLYCVCDSTKNEDGGFFANLITENDNQGKIQVRLESDPLPEEDVEFWHVFKDYDTALNKSNELIDDKVKLLEERNEYEFRQIKLLREENKKVINKN